MPQVFHIPEYFAAILQPASGVASAETRRQLQQRLLDSSFVAQLCLPPSPLTVRELLAIEPGRVLALPLNSSEPIAFNIAGEPMFLAYPVRHGTKKGARVDHRVSIASNLAQEHK